MVREQIALSWQRSASSGLEPAHSLEQSALRDVDRRSRLLAAADPILDRMESMLDGSGYCVLLADRDARLVDLRFGTRTLRDVVFGVGAVVGRSFTEEASGTNSISTSFELRKPLAVRGSEHYMESMKGFSCYGHPLIHPITKRIEGVLDITFLESEDNPLLQPMLAHSAQDIQGRLLEETRSGEQRLFQAFQHASARRRGAPVVAIGDELLLENTSAAAVIDTVDHAALRSLTDESIRRSGVIDSVVLNSGARALVRWERPVSGTGVVLEIDVLDEPARRTSTAAASQPLCVVGEPGTGKSTTLARLTAARAPRWFDAADLVTTTPAAWLASVETQVTAGTDVVVKNIHLADAPVAHRLHALLKSARGWFALSSSIRDTSTAEHRQLLSLCTDTVELAPLRSRRHEIPDLVRGMLAEIGSRARFTPDAMRALIDHDWPGNIGELRDEVMSAAARRSVGDISEHDLVRPGARGASSRLTALDAAMRDAIVHELARCGGNKAATADSLGISRTTLYKRMKELGIH
ncbi:transcriptional regulator [Rhodococcus sp. RS1C4]|uniref:sigma-54-dependent Fis family transcriptional regulator n=1 Tax=Rhodococcoides fascians TaxID=1828 RepID=UPI0003806160|nr:helix-turn-helix domain-containing protein [Rhodococcus fascians]OZC52997.1 transcriptional regulator [Rhodococcus sp. RS1C4]OZC77525.1 transcriptional regulator [Rhodococcus sp. 06-418-1B]OZD14948.1 transcriptional regulator [Rhodococcus sp. 06-156-4C]OZD19969.1 transcriptional regulator [Rhodococcus sp. 06-156-4a]OZD22724.1 transcriptional regulator [Rhodococcus sp. 06-156-3C]OZD25986.1 transcriptional regulator [Rhodococcus sp. 06-156-3b]OZD38194.1 transcriptional regulator [Rhodococcu